MKTVFITGISRGIGKALTLKFLKEGYFVIGTSTNGNADYSDKNLRVFRLDLSIDESIASCASDVNKFGKNIDILINNAGVLYDDGETTVIIEKLRQTLQVNLVGTIDLTQRLLTLIPTGGHIINISSRAGSNTNIRSDEYPAYRISKASLNMFTSYLALKLKGFVTVSSVHPGWVKTDMGGESADIEPEEVADDIYKLATSKDIESGKFWFKGKKTDW